MARITWCRRLLTCVSNFAIVGNSLAPAEVAAPPLTAVAIRPLGGNDRDTTTPIKHVIVICGENRGFDHPFATYRPRHGETVRNAPSKGGIDELGRPGPNFEKAAQYQASDITTFSIAAGKTGPYVALPPTQTGGAPTAASDTDPPQLLLSRRRPLSNTACCRAIFRS